MLNHPIIQPRQRNGACRSIAAVLLLATAPLRAATNYVWSEGSHTPPYDTWATAATNIQTAVDFASTNHPAYHTVLVTDGTYDITTQITITNAITVRSVNGPDITTVQRSGGTTRVLYIDHPDAVVEGLTIRDGNGTSAGAGIYMTGGLLVNCVVTNNLAPRYWVSGGGIHMTGGVVSNCVIAGNRGSENRSGAGIYAANAGCLVVNSIIADNYRSGQYGGGGMYGGTARNCLFVGNSTLADGGGARDVALQNCTLVNNTAGGSGGGAFGGSAINTISYFNSAPLDANRSGGTWTYCCTTPLAVGEGNIDTDPQFFDPDAGDYRVLPGSAAIDAGTNLTWMTGATDLDGNPRIYNDTVDMGAFERWPGALQANFIADTTKGLAAPLMTVVFTAVADGTDTTGLDYQWDFTNSGLPDQTGSDKSVVTNDYSPGNYTVSLTATNAGGESSTVTKSAYIRACAESVYVATNGSATIPYDSWATAATDLQSALDASTVGTTIWVSNGVYEVTTPVVVSEGVTIRSLNGPAVTHLRRGGGNIRVLVIDHPDALVDGLTIRDGSNGNGAGVYMTGGRLVNCVVTNNLLPQHWQEGGGIYMTGGVVSNCVIAGNRGSENRSGAGIYAANAGCLVVNSILANNYRSGFTGGGGMYGGTARNCLFVGNSTFSGGGGGTSATTLFNCTVVSNTAAGSGGGTLGGTVINSIVYFNSAPANPATDNYSGGTFTYSCTTPLPAGDGNIAADPLFVDAAAGDYRLAYLPVISPGIDAGTNQAWMAEATDLDGHPRIRRGRIHEAIAPRVDLGAYEFGATKGAQIQLR